MKNKTNKVNIVKEDVVRNRAFNLEFAKLLKRQMKGEIGIFRVMIDAREKYCYFNEGIYSETDELWIECLCLENLKGLEDGILDRFDSDYSIVYKIVPDTFTFMLKCKENAKTDNEINEELKKLE